MRYLFVLFAGLLATSFQAQPNILWIVAEDISPTLSCYGDSTARTPHLDALAARSTVYENAYAPVGVCAPARSSIITGMYPTSIGTMHMRTGRDISGWGKRAYRKDRSVFDINGEPVREYAAVLPPEVKCFPEYLRRAGYFCSNNAKTDYQFAAPRSVWDENGNHAHWRNRPSEETPFFAVFNFNVTHESRLWKNADQALTVDPAAVPVPPYLPDTDTVRHTIARHYSNLELLDRQVGKLLEELRADGLDDSTVIFFYGDHGGPLPRQKREHYESGLRVPLLVKMPGQNRSARKEELICFVDFAPTLLSVAGVEPNVHFEGRAFLGEYAAPAPTYIFGSGDRFDEFTDRVRTVRGGSMRYVFNFFPKKVSYKDVEYRHQVPMMPHLLRLRDAGRLDSIQQRWFEARGSEELYDVARDPHCLRNLVDDPAYARELSDLRTALRQRLQTAPDLGQLPEARLIDVMGWEKGQPLVSEPLLVEHDDGRCTLRATEPGASLSYLWLDSGSPEPSFENAWQLYLESSLKICPGKTLWVLAERIGYRATTRKFEF